MLQGNHSSGQGGSARHLNGWAQRRGCAQMHAPPLVRACVVSILRRPGYLLLPRTFFAVRFRIFFFHFSYLCLFIFLLLLRFVLSHLTDPRPPQPALAAHSWPLLAAAPAVATGECDAASAPLTNLGATRWAAAAACKRRGERQAVIIFHAPMQRWVGAESGAAPACCTDPVPIALEGANRPAAQSANPRASAAAMAPTVLSCSQRPNESAAT
jgi:hypothetical protein